MALLGREVDVIAQDRMLKCMYDGTTKEVMSAAISTNMHGDSHEDAVVQLSFGVLWL